MALCPKDSNRHSHCCVNLTSHSSNYFHTLSSSVQKETLPTDYLVQAPQLGRSLQKPRRRANCDDKFCIIHQNLISVQNSILYKNVTPSLAECKVYNL